MSLMATCELAGHPASLMSSKHPDGKDAPQAQRARRIVEAMEYETSAEFARFLGVDPRRWNNFETGYPFSRDIVERLIKKVGGLSRDWLYDGNPNGLSVEMARKLGEIPDTASKPADPPRKRPIRRAAG